MSRSIAIPGAALSGLTLALALACGARSPPASSEPTAGPAPVPDDGSGPPMYKPSSSSPAPMSIADPAYGAYAATPEAPDMGTTMPDFEVVLADGGTFELEQARRAGPVLLMFYRGFW